MADISKEIQDFKEAEYGEEVRDSLISLAEKVNAETENNTKEADAATVRAKDAAAKADTAASSTNALKNELQTMKDGDYWRGPNGPQGQSGVTAPSSGMFTLALDPLTGDIFALYPDGSAPPQFEYDKPSGNLYYVIDE